MRPYVDNWRQRFLENRFGKDRQMLEKALGFLLPIREKVLDGIMLGQSMRILNNSFRLGREIGFVLRVLHI